MGYNEYFTKLFLFDNIFLIDSLTSQTFRRLNNIKSNFHFLAPEINKKKAYCIFIWPGEKITKKDLITFKEMFEKEISQNFHYEECRSLNQLNQIELFLIKEDPIDLYYKHLTKQNKRIGDIKLHELNKIEDWSDVFKGEFIV